MVVISNYLKNAAMVMPVLRLYKSSKKEALVDAVAAVRGGMSIRTASEEFDVRKSPLHERVKNVHAKEPGRPWKLDGVTEKTLVDVVTEWATPWEGLRSRGF